jgi:hypothetical protein
MFACQIVLDLPADIRMRTLTLSSKKYCKLTHAVAVPNTLKFKQKRTWGDPCRLKLYPWST